MTKAVAKKSITLKPNDLLLLPPNTFGEAPFAKLVSVEFDAEGAPRVYWVRPLNAPANSEPREWDPRNVIQIFQGVL
jgi:hypothetical protein